MNKVYELVYNTYDAYWHIAISLDKTKLLAMIDQAKEYDLHYKSEMKKLSLDTDYEPNIDIPDDFPLRRLDWFDEEEFLSDYADSNFVGQFEILERSLI